MFCKKYIFLLHLFIYKVFEDTYKATEQTRGMTVARRTLQERKLKLPKTRKRIVFVDERLLA